MAVELSQGILRSKSILIILTVVAVVAISVLLQLHPKARFTPMTMNSLEIPRPNFKAKFTLPVGMTMNSSEIPGQNLKAKLTPPVGMTMNSSEVPGLNLKAEQPHAFEIKEDFTLPMKDYTWPIDKLISKQFMIHLKHFLHKKPTGSLISMATSDSSYEDVLFNWLISATVNTNPPLSHILIISLDKPLHDALVKHGFDSIYIYYQDLLLPKLWEMRRLSLSASVISRFTIMRVINHWGFDVANYDTDAIILKNPEQLYSNYKKSDMIGSRGTFPELAFQIFGLTLCVGTFVIKSTPNIGMFIVIASYIQNVNDCSILTLPLEKFWSVMSEVKEGAFYDDSNGIYRVSDQTKLNSALVKMGLKGNGVGLKDDKTWVGGNADGFTVVIVKSSFICRLANCKARSPSMYVWHHSGGTGKLTTKLASLKQDKLRFLKENWKEGARKSSAKGLEWIKQLKA